jgi:hypothetical protein
VLMLHIVIWWCRAGLYVNRTRTAVVLVMGVLLTSGYRMRLFIEKVNIFNTQMGGVLLRESPIVKNCRIQCGILVT